MTKKIRGILTLLLICVFVAGTFGACANKNEDESSNQNTTADSTTADSTTDSNADTSTSKDLSGEIAMAGSTSMEKVANSLAEAFMAKYPNVVISPQFTGSGAGIEALISGTIDIGNSSRNLKDEEKSSGAVENIICLDGIAVVVDPANTVTDITKDQLIQIFKGEVTNWSELGGADQPIVVIGRESGSGTRGAFEELLKLEDACQYSNEISSTGGVMAKVASTPGSIGYVSLDVVDDSVISLKLDGVDATEANIKAGTYLLQRPFVMATMGAISEQSDLVKTFFDYVQSAEGKDIIKGAGLITID